MDDTPEVESLRRHRLAAELQTIVGFDSTDKETASKWVDRVEQQAARRGVSPDVVVAELRTLRVRAQKNARRRENGYPPINTGIIDRWTVAHLVSGLGMGAMGMTWSEAVAAGAVFELAERMAKERNPEAFPHPRQDSALNTLGDLAAIGIGAWFGGSE